MLMDEYTIIGNNYQYCLEVGLFPAQLYERCHCKMDELPPALNMFVIV